jgi:hypothetical protein
MRVFFVITIVIGVLTAIGNRVLRVIPGRLGQDSVVGWLSSNVGLPLGFTEVHAAKIFSFGWEFGVPLAQALAILCIYLVLNKLLFQGDPQRAKD